MELTQLDFHQDNKMKYYFLFFILLGCSSKESKIVFPTEEITGVLNNSLLYKDSSLDLAIIGDTLVLELVDTSRSFVSEFAHLHAMLLMNAIHRSRVEFSTLKFNYKLTNLNYVYPAIYSRERYQEIVLTLSENPALLKGLQYFSINLTAKEVAYFSGAIEALNERYDFFEFNSDCTSFIVYLLDRSGQARINLCNELEALRRLFEDTKSLSLLKASEYLRQISTCPND